MVTRATRSTSSGLKRHVWVPGALRGTSSNTLFLDDPTEFLADLWADTTGSLEFHVWDYDEGYGDDYANLDAYVWQSTGQFDTTGAQGHVGPVLDACGL